MLVLEKYCNLSLSGNISKGVGFALFRPDIDLVLAGEWLDEKSFLFA